MAENWAVDCVPLGEEGLGPHLTQCARDEAYLYAKFHLDPSSHLPQCTNVTDRTDIQRTDSIGRTVLQTVAQKSFVISPECVVIIIISQFPQCFRRLSLAL